VQRAFVVQTLFAHRAYSKVKVISLCSFLFGSHSMMCYTESPLKFLVCIILSISTARATCSTLKIFYGPELEYLNIYYSYARVYNI
jgi:hypothetical protein